MKGITPSFAIACSSLGALRYKFERWC